MSFGRRNTGTSKGFGGATTSAEIVALPTSLNVASSEEKSRDDDMEKILSVCKNKLYEDCEFNDYSTLSRSELAEKIADVVEDVGQELDANDRRDVVTAALNEFLIDARKNNPDKTIKADAAPALAPMKKPSSASQSSIEEAKQKVQPILMDKMDVSKAIALPRAELSEQISAIVGEILAEQKMRLNLLEQRDLVTTLINDMLGLGPLESLLADEGVTDIMVNGAKQVYVERGGKLELSDVIFRDNAHVMSIATRIVTRIGRRIDESSPLVDARLEDGSRVNIIIPPLAIDGATISIRKFAKQKITLDVMERQQNLSPEMAKVLKIATRSQLNILISGGTGSGKTTLLNALSRMIDDGERVVTIEDAAELQLQQPHVVRLETRPANLEGDGEITQRDLVKNALRMRPDRVILGEIRAGEALDMLQAMNTGHDGSLGTLHANRPREALTRLENLVAMSGVKLPAEAVRTQIAGAVNMIVQISRMRDGVRRITHITEIVGMEGDIITTQDLFKFQFEGETPDGKLYGKFRSTGLKPHFATRAQYFGLERALIEAMSSAPQENEGETKS
ncbi:MAG: CpaF family protein [Rhodospirillaceae bacterium]|jgi:pilus assembly protein CpaF|nr:CpaF family protein [Rhodospirillaceae bacterium]MBT5244325.1 CpaF family protein [Rhodospirillaceae bacterium]MBT6241516.1 CpaF family protein [Rhodospirillaceae bacterium]MBT7137068.1 CpaF family protein [Rhodospirillaceae bacterium]